jgi:hypothetical protein
MYPDPFFGRPLTWALFEHWHTDLWGHPEAEQPTDRPERSARRAFATWLVRLGERLARVHPDQTASRQATMTPR